MKKHILSITLLVLAMVSIAVVSCKKDNQEKTNNNNEQTVQNDNMDEYLTAFRIRLLSAEKSDETIAIDQARRDLGNLLNFDFGDANYPTDIFLHDTVHAKLSVNVNGTVTLGQLANAYNTLVNEIIDSYHNTSLPEMTIQSILCDFKDLGNRDGNDTVKDVEAVVNFRGFVGTTVGIHDTLDWRPKRRAGTCDGQYINQRGGPETIGNWIWQTQTEVECPNGGRVYYTDGDYSYIHGYQIDPNTGTYPLYYYFGTDINSQCIPHAQMEVYYSYILNHWINNVPYDHMLLYLNINCLSVNQYFYYWSVTMGHGKPNCSGTDPLT